VRAALARQNLLAGDVKTARALLEPIAFGVHGTADNPAKKVVELIDAGKLNEARAKIERDEEEDEKD
jgi:hypothetical protein